VEGWWKNDEEWWRKEEKRVEEERDVSHPKGESESMNDGRLLRMMKDCIFIDGGSRLENPSGHFRKGTMF
jgi:hypothetical protein